MKGKVLYIGGFELPDKNAAAQRVFANGKALRHLGHEVVFLGLTKNQPKSYQYQDFCCHEISYPKNKRSWLSFLFSINEESRFIEQHDPDILILYNYPAFKFIFLKNKYRNIKIIGDVTEWYESKGFSLFSLVKRLDVWLRMKIIHPKIDGLIVISDYLEQFYQKYVEKLIKIPPLVDKLDDKWKALNNDSVIQSYNLVYAGSPGVGNKDRLDLVISAIKEVRIKTGKDIQLNVIGLSKYEFLNNFSDFQDEHLDDEYIHFQGRVSHLQALDYVKRADFSIFFRNNNLTNNAGFPTKFAESISAGTPVITNSSSNLGNYFKRYPNIGYLINGLTSREIIYGIELAIKNSKEDIKLKKEFCLNSHIFDYKNFTSDFDVFLKRII